MHGEPEDDNATRATGTAARLIEALARLGGALAALLVLVMLALISFAVIKRYVLGVPVAWADDLSGYLLVAFVAFGMAEAFRRGDHIAIDLLNTDPNGLRGRALRLWANLAVLVFAGLLGWSVWGHARFAHAFGSFTNDQLELPAWIPLVPLVVGAALLAALAASRLATSFRKGPRT